MVDIIEVGRINEFPAMHFPLAIPTFNNATFLENTVSFFHKRGIEEFLVLDNGSTFPRMQEVFDNLPGRSIVISMPDNPGPRTVYENKTIYNWLPEVFMCTDPDLGFKEELNDEMLCHLVELTYQHGFFKLGSALRLDIEEPSVIDVPFNFNGRTITIREIESGYYNNHVLDTKYGGKVYAAAIDTTFFVCNKKFDTGGFMNRNCRADGPYAAHHYGWFMNPPIPQEEYEYYVESVRGKQYASTETLKRGENYSY